MAMLAIFIAVSVLYAGDVTGRCRNNVTHCWYKNLFILEPHVRACHDLCNCTDTTLDCSSNQGKLKFVPHVNESYINLNFSNNKISNISDEDFFCNVSRNVRAIDLYNNGLRFISKGVFDGLDNLTELLLGGSNYLEYKDICCHIPNLQHLSLGCLRFGLAPRTTTNLSLFQSAKSLRTLGLWRNKIYKLHSALLPSLRTLNLESNRLFEFPVSCSDRKNESFFPSLEVLWLDGNMISCIDDPVCLPNLTELHLRYNRFVQLDTDAFFTARFGKLQFLKLNQLDHEFCRIRPYFVNNSIVTNISFTNNDVDFSQHYVNETAFGGCTSVQHLSLSGNNFRDVTKGKFHALLQPMEHSLKALYLGRVRLKFITSNMFSRLSQLRVLHLYGNDLSSIPDGAFNSLYHLTTLTLDQNNIATIAKATFSVHLRMRLQYVTLDCNPFQCTCDILWFQQWMKANPRVFHDYHGKGYRCANIGNISIPSFPLNPQACLLGSDAVAFTIAVTCVLLFFLLLFTILFRFRWHMRLWLYQVFHNSKRGRRSWRYKYDVFVSYAEEDARWVLQELLPVTEGRWGLILCLHQRDFRPGKHIVDNIADCVSESERVVLVFSPHFARSEWCQFELKLCQSVVMERDDVMVLVALQETRSRDMSGAMLAVLRTTTYIEWEEGQDATQAFWGRLRLALEDPDVVATQNNVCSLYMCS
ncbi:toll-like receptor 13 [Littorina saxatilis]|uniref:TIR domain-containing protein n=1 Tax=Littorina saxatilis TaxID=31220 RepID=A0AAN9AYG8_9CAEN